MPEINLIPPPGLQVSVVSSTDATGRHVLDVYLGWEDPGKNGKFAARRQRDEDVADARELCPVCGHKLVRVPDRRVLASGDFGNLHREVPVDSVKPSARAVYPGRGESQGSEATDA